MSRSMYPIYMGLLVLEWKILIELLDVEIEVGDRFEFTALRSAAEFDSMRARAKQLRWD